MKSYKVALLLEVSVAVGISRTSVVGQSGKEAVDAHVAAAKASLRAIRR